MFEYRANDFLFSSRIRFNDRSKSWKIKYSYLQVKLKMQVEIVSVLKLNDEFSKKKKLRYVTSINTLLNTIIN